MKLLRSRFALAAFLMFSAISAAVAKPFPILHTRCAEAAGKNYTLDVTVPTGGYAFSLVRTAAKNGVLNIAVKYTTPSGVVTQALATHRLRFAFENIQRPVRYTVTANGKKLGRAKPIDLRGGVRAD